MLSKTISLCRVTLLCLALLAIIQVSSSATTYYVAADGVDSLTGGTEANPWLSIDYGNTNSLLAPGDTVIVKAGTYYQNVLTDGRSAGVTYQGESGATVVSMGTTTAWDVRDGVGGGMYGFNSYDGLKIDGFTIEGGGAGWVGALSIYCAWGIEVCNCVIDGGGTASTTAFSLITTAGNNIHNNVIKYGGAGSALRVADSRFDGSQFLNNVLEGHPGGWAIDVAYYFDGYQPGLGSYEGHYDSFINNIITGAYAGLSCPDNPNFIVEHDYNMFWNCNTPYYQGCEQSANETTTVDPLFVDAANGDYRLQATSPAIDAGLDVGLPYIGTAPDIGAFEAVPEPGTLTALALGLVGLGGFRLRRKG